ncbi:hypothetical protein [Lacihabitans soyangensis]|uniref:Uncharacterized protein n=1 Tax=Lacihabitans soyangensis TaxID=869394 RepID=A0AAE3KW68_9BACT|nr:hypothetical protein [Lacihabitans soyangensis]MCP9765141.1 hypothetical protein [Lacihabitans soyangensis]
MDDKELRRQKILAKAHFDSVLQLFEHGLATKDDLEAKRKIWQDLKGFDPAMIAKPEKVIFTPRADINVKVPSETQRGLNPNCLIVDESFDEAAELEAIQAELHEVDMRKNKKINELAKMPRDSNQLPLVTEIKALREEYVNKSDEVYYFKRHGERVSAAFDSAQGPGELNSELVSFDDSEFVKSLPRDKLALHKMKKSLESSLSKFKARLAAAKTEVKKASQNKNISIATIKINTIDQLMSTL